MIFKTFVRKIHLGFPLWTTNSSSSLLAQLRKNTGYTFANCKKALEMNQNDLKKAEEWLHQQAQSFGWSKVTKLSGRTTAQGLVAVRFDDFHASLVEVNCETDFVAKNEKFRGMVEEAVNACYKISHTTILAKGSLTKMCLDSERLGVLHSASGKTLSDELALMIGSVGENAALRRAECWKATHGLHLMAYTHPAETNVVNNYSYGKYGGILAYIPEEQNDDHKIIARQLCQHIVGNNPTKIGDTESDKPAANSDDETCLIYQEFLADQNKIVKDVLEEHKIKIVDFVRFECGEALEAFKEHVQTLENVNTCQ